MNPSLLQILACPECCSDLRLETNDSDQILSGKLVCLACNAFFEIKEGIPFFSPQILHDGVKNQQETYSTWWDDYHDESSITNPQTKSFFYNSLRIEPDEITGKRVLDAGCGNGRFSFVVSQYNPELLVSFDISSGVLHARKAITKYHPHANVAYVQGDITKPPFKKGVFDVAFSWGVIHHTPDTRKTFTTVSQLVKDQGLFGVYVYEFHPHYHYTQQSLGFLAYLRSLFLIRPLRALCSHLPAKTVHALFIPIYYLERFFNFGIMGCHGYPEDRWNKDRYFRVVIDRFKTRYASEHQLEEVIGWFREEGFNELRAGWEPRVSLSGIKTNSNANLEISILTSPVSLPKITQRLQSIS